MGKIAFIGWLFIMALACLGLGISSASLGWFIGGVVFLFVAIYALRQGKKEMLAGPGTASNKFILVAFSVLFIGFAAIVFLANAQP